MCIRDSPGRAGTDFGSPREGGQGPHTRRGPGEGRGAVSYTHLRAHETPEHLVCRLLLEKKKRTHADGRVKLRQRGWGVRCFVWGRGRVGVCFFFNDTATTEIYTRSLVGSVRCV